MKNTFFAILVVTSVFFLFASSTNAVPLTISRPSVATLLPGTTSAMSTQLAGTIVEDDDIPFEYDAYGGLVFGTVQVRVVWADDNTYDFYWRIKNRVGSAGEVSDGSIEEFRIGNFFNTTIYDGDFRIDGLGDLQPESARAFADASGNPDGYINFNFPVEGLKPEQESKFFFLDTDATNYDRTLVYDLTSNDASENSSSFIGFAPAPGSVASTAVMGDGVEIKKGVTVASHAEIGSNTILNKGSIVGAKTVVGDNTLLEKNSVIGNDSIIGKNVKISKNVLIGNGVKIGDNTVIKKGTVIRDSATIGMNVTLGKNVTVLELVHVPDDENIPNGTVIMLQ